MPELEHLKRDVSKGEIWSAIDQHGGVIIDDFLDKRMLSRLREDVMPAVSNVEHGAKAGHEFWKQFRHKQNE